MDVSSSHTLTESQAVIDHLNEILKHEWTGVQQYSQAAFIVEGLMRELYAPKFQEDADESFGHAKLVGEKIAALGGVPTVLRNEVKQSRDVRELVENALAFESKAVEMYSAAIELAEEHADRSLVVFLEDILAQEQEGVDEYSKLLRDTPAKQGEVETATSRSAAA
ncbi:bacterioferritin [Alienimonas sp. DA493]|uniref:ferritin-like domain-containing protein n=1 Tax=Alienimonas sp. DA493 TaxID=3373605 RepID=UPI0037545A7B